MYEMLVKKHLFAPGPVQVPEEILLEMAKPLMHHRTPQFSKVIEKIWEDLKYLFQTKQDVYFFASSGTGAMNAAVVNTLSKGDKVIVISGGKFGERWGEICQTYGLNVVWAKVEYGYDFPPEKLEELLKQHPDTKAVLTEYSETSTGVLFPVKEYAKIVSKTNAILIVDAISALGVVDLKMDEWGIDVVVGGSQKSLMLPPGLSFIALSEKAWEYVERSDLPKFYFSLKAEKKARKDSTTAWTPAISLLSGLSKALDMIKEEGLETVIKRHAVVAKAVREGVKALNLELFPKATPSNSVTTVKVPEGIEGGKIPKLMRDKYGVTIAGGQGELKGKIFRIGHMGYFDKGDVLIALQALEFTLKELGWKFTPGASIQKAQEILLEEYEF